MLISGLNKTTLLDYPGRVAATVFTGGCNFRCPFCHNAGLVLSPMTQETYSESSVLSFLNKRKTILSGVCITGGEPTIQQDLPDFIEKIRQLGLCVKLDTNGSHPALLRDLIEKKLIDYVAVDIKNSSDRYEETIGCHMTDREAVCETVELLKESSVEYEFRTTVVRELHTMENLQKICEWIVGSPRYFLQQFEDSGELIGTRMNKEYTFHGYTAQEMKAMAEQLNENSPMKGNVYLRGVEG